MTGHPAQKQKPWTSSQHELLERLRGQGVPWDVVAVRCGHSAASCSTTLSTLRKSRNTPAWISPEPKPNNKKELRRAWSEQDLAELIRLHDVENMPFSQIDRILQRSFGGCRTKYETMQRPRASAHQIHPSEPGSHVKATPEALADRDARKRLEHLSLTAAQFGDPLPGRSALDQKRGAL